MVIQHGGDVLVRRQYENSHCSVRPNELLVSTQPLVHNLKFPISVTTNIKFYTSGSPVSIEETTEDLRPIYTVRLCRMRQAYDRPTT